ncbi:HNH endonuclease [Neisseriaceae bacterium TC5R-5]|nr:HNH endonuclease [Neisseriaceae bacterium TC5R-5]
MATEFKRVRDDMLTFFAEYNCLAKDHQLFSLTAKERGNDSQLVIANITKENLINLYSEMTKVGKPGRDYYDSLRGLAPLGICPFCGIGQVSTLDHFLPKAYYPEFSILPINLIPACADCNKNKGAQKIEEHTQTLHPYFEGNIIETVQWMFAEVNESTPVTVRYFVQPPSFWSDGLKQRIDNYASNYILGRFEIQAAPELVELSGHLNQLGIKKI